MRMIDSECLPFVRRFAQCVAKKYGGDLDDLVGEGCLALVKARRRFREDRGASFKTFAGFAVRGAMLDHVRRNKPLSRHQLRKVRRGEADPVWLVREELAEDVPVLQATTEQRIDAKRLMRRLGLRHRSVVLDIFWRGRSHADVGAALGVTASRVAQLRAEAMQMLRRAA